MMAFQYGCRHASHGEKLNIIKNGFLSKSNKVCAVIYLHACWERVFIFISNSFFHWKSSTARKNFNEI